MISHLGLIDKEKEKGSGGKVGEINLWSGIVSPWRLLFLKGSPSGERRGKEGGVAGVDLGKESLYHLRLHHLGH